jgi:glycosyltransferase involved in cell wall biosynthesis
MPDARPHILFLSELLTWPLPLTGGQIRIAYVLEKLLQHYRVSFAACAPADELATLDSWPLLKRFESVLLRPSMPPFIGSRWGGLVPTLRTLLPRDVPVDLMERAPEPLREPLRALARSGAIDAVWASRSWMAELAKDAGFRRIAVDVDDFEGPMLAKEIERSRPYRRQGLHRVLARRLIAYESSIAERFSTTVIAKTEDLQQIAPAFRQRVVLVPNGLEIPGAVTPIRFDPPTLLFVGALGYRPNVDAVTWFADEIFPLVRRSIADCRFLIAGRGPVPDTLARLVQLPGITLVESPLEIAAMYQMSSVVVAPVRLGNGTRLKVLEALGFGRPLVGTTEVVTGLGLVAGQHFRCADTATAFAGECVELLTNVPAARAIADAGRTFVEQGASWATAMRAVPEVIERALSARSA